MDDVKLQCRHSTCGGSVSIERMFPGDSDFVKLTVNHKSSVAVLTLDDLANAIEMLSAGYPREET